MNRLKTLIANYMKIVNPLKNWKTEGLPHSVSKSQFHHFRSPHGFVNYFLFRSYFNHRRV